MGPKRQFQNVRGTYDILPEDYPKFAHVVSVFKQLASAAGYDQIDTPIIEEAAVFTKSVGEGTDIVDNEMYQLEDKSGNLLVLRPESTAAVVRAYIQHGLSSRPKPVKLYWVMPMFRYERPQAGRFRQHLQLGVEVLGEAAPNMDAHVITLALRFYKMLGLRDISLQLNSLGDHVCRPKYRQALVEYLEGHRQKLCEDCQDRIKSNPLRVLDCKVESCQPVIAGAPQTLNYLCKPCQNHFTGVLEYLDELKVPYELNPRLVRGFDYYSRTLFEVYGKREGSQSAIGGGGRYDYLVEQMGGAATPGIGFGIGVERVLIELEEAGIDTPKPPTLKVFVAALGEPARLSAFTLIEQLLDEGVAANGSVTKDSIGSQLGKADRLSASYAIIIGQKEVFDGTVILRDMNSGAQEVIPREKIVAAVQKRLQSGTS